MIIAGGICFGLRPDKQSLGDVVVSAKVRVYEPQRITGGNWFRRPKIMLRGEFIAPSAMLLNRTRSLKLSWNKSSVHEGTILSGEKLVDSREFVGQKCRVRQQL